MKIKITFLVSLAVFIVISFVLSVSCSKESVPVLTTAEISNITSTTATSGGNITDDGGTAVTSRGVCWSTSIKPAIEDNKTNDASGAGSYSSKLTGLSPYTVYFVRAYATNGSGTGYGEPLPFITPPRTSRTDILTSKSWRLFSSTYNGIAEVIDDCAKDDFSTFKANGTLEENPGAIKCYDDDIVQTYSWSISSDENYLTVDGTTFTIIELSENILVLKIIEGSDIMMATLVPI